MIWPFRNRTTEQILDGLREPVWKVEPPRPWPDPPEKGARVSITYGNFIRLTGMLSMASGFIGERTKTSKQVRDELIAARDKSYADMKWIEE